MTPFSSNKVTFQMNVCGNKIKWDVFVLRKAICWLEGNRVSPSCGGNEVKGQIQIECRSYFPFLWGFSWFYYLPKIDLRPIVKPPTNGKLWVEHRKKLECILKGIKAKKWTKHYHVGLKHFAFLFNNIFLTGTLLNLAIFYSIPLICLARNCFSCKTNL